jgi:hypothetical protein
VVAAVLAACGGGSGGGSSDGAGRQANRDRPTQARDRASCTEADDEVLFSYQRFFEPVSAADDTRIDLLRGYLQFADDPDVSEFIGTLLASAPPPPFGDTPGVKTNPVWDNFSSAQFGSVNQAPATFTIVSVDYPKGDATVLLFTVEQEAQGSSGIPGATPRTVAQVAGRLVCVDGTWRVALADLCEIVAAGPGPACPDEVAEKAERGLPSALDEADLPALPPPTVEAPPEPSFVPAPQPLPGSDGVCPYVGQPCSANTTNDPDCICTEVGGGPGFADGGPGTLTCRGTPLFG